MIGGFGMRLFKATAPMEDQMRRKNIMRQYVEPYKDLNILHVAGPLRNIHKACPKT